MNDKLKGIIFKLYLVIVFILLIIMLVGIYYIISNGYTL
jgi:hypothetical protein